MGTALESNINTLGSLGNLAKLFTGEDKTTSRTSQTMLSQDAINAILRQALESNQGLAAVSAGQKAPGMYNTTSQQLLINDLLSRTSGEIAVRGAPTTETSRTVAPPAMDIGSTLGTAAALYAGKKLVWDKFGIGEAIDETLGVKGFLGGSSGAAAAPTTAISGATAVPYAGTGISTVGSTAGGISLASGFEPTVARVLPDMAATTGGTISGAGLGTLGGEAAAGAATNSYGPGYFDYETLEGGIAGSGASPGYGPNYFDYETAAGVETAAGDFGYWDTSAAVDSGATTAAYATDYAGMEAGAATAPGIMGTEMWAGGPTVGGVLPYAGAIVKVAEGDVETGAKMAAGTYVGQATLGAALTPVLGPLGPVVGGFIGSIVGGGCFITTAVCALQGKPDDCHELTVLRNYRDTYLAAAHPDDIQQYYTEAPGIVARLSTHPHAAAIYSSFYKNYIVPAVSAVEAGRNEMAYSIYRALFELAARIANEREE